MNWWDWSGRLVPLHQIFPPLAAKRLRSGARRSRRKRWWAWRVPDMSSEPSHFTESLKSPKCARRRSWWKVLVRTRHPIDTKSFHHCEQNHREQARIRMVETIVRRGTGRQDRAPPISSTLDNRPYRLPKVESIGDRDTRDRNTQIGRNALSNRASASQSGRGSQYFPPFSSKSTTLVPRASTLSPRCSPLASTKPSTFGPIVCIQAPNPSTFVGLSL